MSDWRQTYMDKLCTAEQAIQSINNGDRVLVGGDLDHRAGFVMDAHVLQVQGHPALLRAVHPELPVCQRPGNQIFPRRGDRNKAAFAHHALRRAFAGAVRKGDGDQLRRRGGGEAQKRRQQDEDNNRFFHSDRFPS